jgi:hypothetical protein
MCIKSEAQIFKQFVKIDKIRMWKARNGYLLPTFLTPQVVVPSSSACISLLLYGGFIIEIRRHSFVLLFSLQQYIMQ